MSSDEATSSQVWDDLPGRYRTLIGEALLPALRDASGSMALSPDAAKLLEGFYGQIEYHLGWRTPDLRPKPWQPGKLLRPTLLLLSCEVAVGRGASPTGQERAAVVHAAIPAAVAVELVHNFSLVHDDIEDSDEERHHLPTLWKLWGVPQAINTGDGIFALAHAQLRHLHERGIAAETVLALMARLDITTIELCEGQYLDMRYEGRRDVSVAMYLDMIGRKTASLMGCAASMGGLIGAPQNDTLSQQLGDFGRALGMGFQLRDDLLGIWSATELGKSEAGDLRKKKMSLPIIFALEHASTADARTLTDIYDAPGLATEPQITTLLAVLERTGARERTRAMLRAQCDRARDLLDSVRANTSATDAGAALGDLLDFVASEGI